MLFKKANGLSKSDSPLRNGCGLKGDPIGKLKSGKSENRKLVCFRHTVKHMVLAQKLNDGF